MSTFKGYIAVVLDTASVAKLKEAFPPAFPNIFYHHVTVAYMPDTADEAFDFYEEGDVVSFETAFAPVVLSGVQCIRVDGVKSVNRNPHITLSVEPGTSPAKSNEVLLLSEKELAPSIELKGTVVYNRF